MCKYKSGQLAGFFSALIISSLEHHFFANQANIDIMNWDQSLMIFGPDLEVKSTTYNIIFTCFLICKGAC